MILSGQHMIVVCWVSRQMLHLFVGIDVLCLGIDVNERFVGGQ